MVLTFMGMSGAGKSFWSGQFAAQGWKVFDCDALIATKLQISTGFSGQSLAEVGHWMGLPDAADFRQREAAYLACEQAVMLEIMEHVQDCIANHTSCVIDTSGSVIYTDLEVLQQLRAISAVLYLRTPAALYDQMLNAYLAQPRPVVWNGLFQPLPNESRTDTFRRCYVQLIRQRDQLYALNSDIVLDYNDYRQPELTVERLLAYVRAAAERIGVAHKLYGGTAWL